WEGTMPDRMAVLRTVPPGRRTRTDYRAYFTVQWHGATAPRGSGPRSIMLRIYVLGNARKSGVVGEVERFLPLLREAAEVVLVDLHQEADLAGPDRADVALVFGGDGAILRAARQMGYHQVPVLGVNLGRLGFLADIHPQEFVTAFHQVAAGDYRVTRHLMYECVVQDTEGGTAQTFLGLNEVAVHNTPPFHMLELELELDGGPVVRFGGDGLIVSTPIGST